MWDERIPRSKSFHRGLMGISPKDTATPAPAARRNNFLQKKPRGIPILKLMRIFFRLGESKKRTGVDRGIQIRERGRAEYFSL